MSSPGTSMTRTEGDVVCIGACAGGFLETDQAPPAGVSWLHHLEKVLYRVLDNSVNLICRRTRASSPDDVSQSQARVLP